ncbi:MAG: ATP/GTP-binding protein [Candidatus Methanomethylophilaceae archaeon]
MLVSFSLENFKSFGVETTIEMMPGKSRSKSNHIKDDCLTIGAVYGNVAAGKSNLVDGLRTLKDILTNPFLHSRKPINHWDSENTDTRFCIEFTIGHYLYSYELTVSSEIMINKGQWNRLYMFPVRSEKLSYVDLRYESDKNGNVTTVPVLIRPDRRPAQTGLKGISRLLYERENLTTKLVRFNGLPSVKKSNPEDGIDSGTIDLDPPINHRSCMDRNNHLRMEYREKLEKNGRDLQLELSLNEMPSTLNDTCPPSLYEYLSDDAEMHLDNVRRWFDSCLCIMDMDDIYIPDSDDSIPILSGILGKIDLGIEGLEWRKVSSAESGRIMDSVSLNDQLQIQGRMSESRRPNSQSSYITKTKVGILRFTFRSGKVRVERLTSTHSNGRDGRTCSESDGTLRVIEMASMLIHTDEDITFVVDEIEQHLHPTLTRRIIDTYLDDRSPSKQLIFTTHETEILTTDIFRRDEVWFVQKKDGCSHLEALDTITGLNSNRRLERLYLEDRVLPGIPNCSKGRLGV